MTALYRGEVVRVVSTRGPKSRIVTRRGPRWVRTDELEVTP